VAGIRLSVITADNWRECIELRVRDEQAELVPDNLYSIAEAQFYPDAVPLAIHNDEGQMVGFVMYGIEVTSGKWKVFRLMIDRAYQGLGYGRAAMQQVIARLAAQQGCDEVLISYRPDNDAARQLYASLGFVEQEVKEDKVTASLELNTAADIGRFYAGIGALLWCPSTGKYLVLRRAAHRDAGGGAWECVTGRVNQGEGFSEAVRREVREELGIEVQVEFIIGTSHLYRGDERPENELVGVLYGCSIDDPEAIKVSDEHSEHHWVTVEEARDRFSGAHWLVRMIERAEAIRSLLSPELLDFYTANGFEV
jgi:ribosomal protein S18 acetylase RimI-like enzyme/8-oxo-dGTP pyrophosphatase MutT (NUDIX family)